MTSQNKSLIQPSEILPVELTGTHKTCIFWNLHSKQLFLKQLIQMLNMTLKIENAYFHIFTKHLSVVFKMEFSKRTF